MGEVVDEHGVALEFKTEQDFRTAIDTIYKHKISHVLVGGRTVIVPRARVDLFKSLDFEQTDVLSAADLPPEEIAELRRENLSFNDG